MKIYSSLIINLLLFTGCATQQTVQIEPGLTVHADLLFSDDFSKETQNWIVEQMPGGTVSFADGSMEIEDKNGCTVWFREKLQAPLMITCDVRVIASGGPFDRVSDMNCFWLATDPLSPDIFFARTNERSGKFQDYDHMALYYVGLGGHNNSRTRFRRYDGKGGKPLLETHDLTDKKYLIEPNALNHIKIVVWGNRVQYYRNNLLIFDYDDAAPLQEGYFGLRTWVNHMTADQFKVYSLTEK